MHLTGAKKNCFRVCFLLCVDPRRCISAYNVPIIACLDSRVFIITTNVESWAPNFSSMAPRLRKRIEMNVRLFSFVSP